MRVLGCLLHANYLALIRVQSNVGGVVQEINAQVLRRYPVTSSRQTNALEWLRWRQVQSSAT